jgi:cytochrome P450
MYQVHCHLGTEQRIDESEHMSQEGGGTTGCPHLTGFDPLIPEQNADPFPWFARARREAPVFYMPRYDMWAVTRHADNVTVLRDHSTFSNLGSLNLRVAPPAAMSDQLPDGYVFPTSIAQITIMDPPRHTQIRKPMQAPLTWKSMKAHEGDARCIADSLIDDFVAAGRVELMAAYAFPLPIDFFGLIFGFPEDDTSHFLRWAEDYFQIVGTVDIPEKEAAERWKSLLEFDAWGREFIAERRANPSDDLTSHLISTKSDDGSPSLTDDEILANVLGLILGGVDTTAFLIGQTVYELLANGLWAKVEADRSLLPRAIEETLRLRGPVRGVRRTTMKEVELGGATIPKGATLWLLNQSANRDEAAFDNPDTFDIGRRNVGEHLGLGLGVHFCIGAPMARLEAHVALDCLMDRLPGLRLSESQGELDFFVNMVLPCLRSLELEWDE